MTALRIDSELVAPDRSATERQLHHLFGELPANCDGLLEIAWTGPGHGAPASAKQFDLIDLDQAADLVEAHAAEGRNVYLSAGLRAPNTPRGIRAPGSFVQAVAALWADFDDEGAAAAARQMAENLGIPPTMVVQTATVPHQRAQFWWRLEEPCTDLAAVSNALAALALTLGGDPSVRNVDRVMRAAGSIAHAVKPGRITETVRILDDWSSHRPPYALAEITRPLPGAQPQRVGNLASIFDFNGPRPGSAPAERFAATYQAGQWHENSRDLIGRLVREGASDETIAALAPAFQRDGYSLKQTERELLEFARGARAKGWAPEAVQAQGERTARDTGAEGEQTGDAFDASPFDGVIPPPRRWAFGRLLLHRATAALVAPPGTGKTTWALQLAVDFALHRPLGPLKPYDTGPVWVWNNEDDRDELNRRVLAACMAEGVDPAQLAGRLYLNTGAERALIVAREDKRSGTLVATPDVARVVEIIRARGIKLLIVDPFAETYEANEISNDIMKGVAALYRRIAWEGDCCVLLVCHTPKGANSDNRAGELDAIRGGGSIGGVVRSAATLFGMSKEDASELGIPVDARHLYVRLDDAKANNSLKSSKPTWWRKETVLLGNGTATEPQDAVGVLEHIDLAPATVTEAERVAAADMELNTLAREVVRVCRANGHTTSDTAATIAKLCEAVDATVTRMGATKARGMITGRMANGFEIEGDRIVTTHAFRGSLHVQRIYVEAVDAAA